jgi:hypothetical protein
MRSLKKKMLSDITSAKAYQDLYLKNAQSVQHIKFEKEDNEIKKINSKKSL